MSHSGSPTSRQRTDSGNGGQQQLKKRTSRCLNVKRTTDDDDADVMLFTMHDDVSGSLVHWPKVCSDSSIDEHDAVLFACFNDVISERQGHGLRNASIDAGSPTQINFSHDSQQTQFTAAQWEALYVEALYTVRHRIGQAKDAAALSDAALTSYVQHAFGMSQAEHERLLAKACQEKSPVVVLEVTVVEGRKLEAKDADGFSDPYCMLGIVSQSAATDDDSSAANGNGGKKKITATAVDMIPARFIKTTSVKENTLSPVWNEKFRFDLADVQTDVLHLDIWDHDDESSVADSARRLNQVKGLKGLGRYFKQIAQSARKPSDLSNPATETLDDFLGTVDVPLVDIPSTGLDVWMDLKGRSARSKVEGYIHLKLALATREERELPDDEHQFETKQHCDLMMIFIGHEYKRSKEDARVWTGELPVVAKTILHQHAVQGDITEAQQAICLWVAMSRKFCDQPFDWSILIRCLDELDKKWSPHDVYKEEEFAVADSFDLIIQYSLSLMSHHLMTSQITWSPAKLQDVLTCLKKLYDTKVFKRCCLFKRELRSEIISAVKKSVAERYQRLQQARQSKASVDGVDTEALIIGYVELLDKLNFWLKTVLQQFNQVFISHVDVNFFAISYRETYASFTADIRSDLELIASLVSETDIDDNLSLINEVQTIVPVLHLYCGLRDFLNFKLSFSSREASKLPAFDFGAIFRPHVERWLAIVKHVVSCRVLTAVTLDKVEAAVTSNAKHSSSSTDIAYTFGQVVSLWQCIRHPESSSAKDYVLAITKLLCEAATSYAGLMHRKMKEAGYYDDVGQFDITPQLCIAINNIELVRRALLALPVALNFNQLKPDSNSTESQDPNTILTAVVHATDDQMTQEIKRVADHVADKMRADIKRFVFHLCWAPERALSHEAIGDLMNYLDSNLLTINTNLLRENFIRVLDSIWLEVLEEFDEVLSRPDEELQEAKWMPNRLLESLQILLEFFHADGKGLALTNIHCSLYNDLYKQLQLIQTPSNELIQQYFAEKLEHQRQIADSRGGILTVRVFYNAGAKLLTVEVLNAKNLLPQDLNGLSDPYITIELQPSHVFPGLKTQQTKVVKNTLNPTFEEPFTFDSITEDQCNQLGACVVLSVMDQDILSANDFAGEAFVPLRQADGGQKQKPGSGCQTGLLPINLSIVNYGAPPATKTVGKGRRGILAALLMKFDEPSTLQFATRRHHLDYTVHRQSED